MNPVRPHHVIRILQRLPSLATAPKAVPAQIGRYSSVPSRSPNGSSGSISNKPHARAPRKGSSESSSRPAPYSTRNPPGRSEVSEITRELLNRLGIAWPNERGSYEKVPLPKHFAAAPYFNCMYSMDHVIDTFDVPYFALQNFAENPRALAAAYYYEKKKEQPLWQWYQGSYKFGRAGVVICARDRFIKALRTALFVRGYDISGRRLASSPRGRDVRGTLRFYASQPQEFRTQVTMREVQEAVEYCLDYVIHKSEMRRDRFRPSINLEKSLRSRWASKKEMSRPNPSLRGLVYRPWLRKEDMVLRPQPEREELPARSKDMSRNGTPEKPPRTQLLQEDTSRKLDSRRLVPTPKQWSLPEIKRPKTLTWKRKDTSS